MCSDDSCQAGAPEPIDLPHVIDTTNMANEHSNGFTNPLYAEGPVEVRGQNLTCDVHLTPAEVLRKSPFVAFEHCSVCS